MPKVAFRARIKWGAAGGTALPPCLLLGLKEIFLESLSRGR
jgi:hypothetical protein